jgi:hypothetical protein
MCILDRLLRISVCQKVWRFQMSSENMTSGFDLSYPLMSKPTENSKSASVKIQVPCEKMTGGFDLSWPLMSQCPDVQHEEGERIKRAA